MEKAIEVDRRTERQDNQKLVDPVSKQDKAVKPPPPKPIQPTVPQPILWQRAKQELVTWNSSHVQYNGS